MSIRRFYFKKEQNTNYSWYIQMNILLISYSNHSYENNQNIQSPMKAIIVRKVQRTETDFQLQEMQSLDKSKLTSSDF